MKGSQVRLALAALMALDHGAGVQRGTLTRAQLSSWDRERAPTDQRKRGLAPTGVDGSEGAASGRNANASITFCQRHPCGNQQNAERAGQQDDGQAAKLGVESLVHATHPFARRA